MKMSGTVNNAQAHRSEIGRADSHLQSGDLGKALGRLRESNHSATQSLFVRQPNREQRIAALNFALDIGKTLNHLLHGSKRDISKISSPSTQTNKPKEPTPSKSARPPSTARLRKVVTASRASSSRAITRTKQRRNSTSAVGKPRFGRRQPPKRRKREPEEE